MTPELRQQVLVRDSYSCVLCGDLVTTFVSVHHRKLRSQGGKDDAANLITLCGTGTQGCHHTVHSRRKTVGEPGGYIVPGWVPDPATIPVRCKRRGLVWLTSDGGWDTHAASV